MNYQVTLSNTNRMSAIVAALTLCIGFGVPHIAKSQSPYRTKWDTELMFHGGGILAMGAGAYLRNQVTLFTPEELEHLDQGKVLELDREATEMFSTDANRTSDYVMQGALALPLVFLAGSESRSHFGQIALMYGETVLINTGLTSIVKFAVHRPRPYVYNAGVDLSRAQSVNAQASFVSGHTSAAAASSFFVAKVYSDFYPESKWKPVVWATAAVIPAVTGYLRVRAGKHYPTDVIGGYALGAAVGYLVPELHRTRDKNGDFTVIAMPNGFFLNMKF